MRGAETTPILTGLGVGVAAVLIAYEWSAWKWTAACVAGGIILGVMVWCLVLAWERPELDLERAGDGCYYLGLVLTMVSLVVMLSGFDAASGAEAGAAARTNDMISKFGVALASTAAGIVSRIVLQLYAGGEDWEEEELTPERARAIYAGRLGTATGHMVREVRRAERGFRRLGRSALRQAERLEHRGARSADRTLAEMRETLGRTREEMTRHEGDMGQTLARAARAYETMARAGESLTRTVRSTADATRETGKAVEGLTEEMQALRREIRRAGEQIDADRRERKGLGRRDGGGTGPAP